jgi:ureidoacrylate peracid hydrolase
VQNDYCHINGACAKSGKDVSAADSIINPTKKLLHIARSYGIPVIFIQTVHEKATDSEAWCRRMGGSTGNICRRNTWGGEFYKLEPQEPDIIVEKHRYSAFIGTKLESVLNTLKVETLLITGVATNVCVESTARDGYMLDYHVFLFEDCCAAFDQEEHKMALCNVDSYFGTVTKVNEFEEMMEDNKFINSRSMGKRPSREKVSAAEV